jgi:hypothetical protein
LTRFKAKRATLLQPTVFKIFTTLKTNMKFIFLIPVILGLAVAGPMSPLDHDGNVLERQLPDPGKACTSKQEKVRMRLTAWQRGVLFVFIITIVAIG